MGKQFGLCSLFLLSMCFVRPVASDSVHVLADGETLYSLSLRYQVDLADIMARNGIADPSALPIGTRLIIPDGELGGGTAEYTVAKGDTYYSIAREHQMSVEELLAVNARLPNRILRVAETLVVSGPALIQPTPLPALRTESQVEDVPWWPVAGKMRPLDGKLTGVAIETSPMSYVHAVASGSVVWTGPYRGFGNVALVDSEGYIYLYGGNEDLFVNVGQSVNAGSRIGRLGPADPSGGGKKVFFSVFREGVPIAPDEAPRG